MSYVIIDGTVYFSKANIYTLLEYLSIFLGLGDLGQYPQASIVLKGSRYMVYCSGDAVCGLGLVEKYFCGIPYEVCKYSESVYLGRGLVFNYLPIQNPYCDGHILEKPEELP